MLSGRSFRLRDAAPGFVTVAPASANAVFDLTGERIRELPIQRHLRG